jgi:glyoxylase-like metal-dependent hydrolase (beta-lactamase superfamily II)
MPRELARGLYRLEIPLPNNPLKSLNSYVIKGSGRNLIIDTGLNREECMAAMQDGLKEIGVDLRETDFFITHLHADHFGLVSSLVTDTSKIFFNRPDAELMEGRGNWDRMIQYADAVGFPEDELRAALQNHPGFKYGGTWTPELKLLREGDIISAGDYAFRCVETPGHTRGHICLYEPKKKFLVAGDHILGDITPNIQLWSDNEDPLKAYLKSLEKISKFDVELVLPGHRRIFTDCKRRIGELIEHHRRRADEVLRILQDGAQNAYQVASRMTWDIKYPSWDDFPVSQRWFATGEAISHLKYLQERKELYRHVSDGKVLFSLQ